MKILFLFSRHSEKLEDSTLTKDLSDEFYKKGHEVTVITLLERKYNRNTELKIENGYKVLRVETGNYFDNVGKIEKGLTAFLLPYNFKKGISKNLKNEKYDLIFSHTPFIANPQILKWLKKRYGCPVMIDLWDIFPQNAIDLKMINNKILLKLFERTERKMYEVADYIGCMSKGNLEYMKNHDFKFKESKYFILKNWAIIKEKLNIDKEKIKEKYGFNKNDFICIFGGNMGKPQKLENILELAKKCKIDNIKFLFVGKGTENKKLKEIKEINGLKNVFFIDYIPREDYELLTGACEIGIVSLDERFTVPNFPSKTTDYFKLELPILASLDNCAANDYGVFLQEEVKAGLFSLAGDIEKLYVNLLKLYNDKNLREILGKNGRNYYENELSVEKAYEKIISVINKKNQ